MARDKTAPTDVRLFCDSISDHARRWLLWFPCGHLDLPDLAAVGEIVVKILEIAIDVGGPLMTSQHN